MTPKETRRSEATKRQAVYDGMTIEQRIARAKSRRGNSRREISRLEASLAKRTENANPA